MESSSRRVDDAENTEKAKSAEPMKDDVTRRLFEHEREERQSGRTWQNA